MRELINKLNQASDAYYNGNNPIMSDAEWDELFDQLKVMERESGIIMSDSPTQNVGYEVKSELKKVKHEVPMLSLDKTKSIDDLHDFAKKKECVLSLKMDGLSIRLTYQDGNLVRAETRGNGEVGEDVTHNARVIKNIPLTIPFKGKYMIDGECIITYDDFEAINEKLPDDQKYKNPRNLASGSIRQLDSGIASKRNMRFIAWRVINGDRYGKDLLVAMSNYGFEIVPMITYLSSLDIKAEELKTLRECAAEKSYPIDGLVLTFDDVQYGNSLGATGHHNKHSIAFKFGEEETETKLIDIEWTMGKTGELTPVAIFEPVELCGTTVSKASLHNLSVMEDLYNGPWHKGMDLTVVKANEIIPQIVSARPVADKSVVLSSIDKCPICGGSVAVDDTVNYKRIICINPHCNGKLLGRISHACSREALDIRGLSEKTIEMLIDKGYVNSLSDIFYLNMLKNTLSALPGMGAKSVDKLLKAIDKAKDTTLQRFIIALNIPNVGKSTAKILANHADDFEDFMSKAFNGYRWSVLDDIGDGTELAINQFVDNYYEDICDLAYHFNISNNKEKFNNKLEGKVFVVTGKLQHYSNRKELESVIVANGGKVAGSVSKNTYALINNDINSNSGKNKKAKDLGIKIITEKEFIKEVN